MDLDKAIQSRKSVKKFKDKKPDWRDIIECIDATRFAPMAGNIYTPRFIIVSDPKKIQKLADASQQSFVAQAKYVVVMCSAIDKTVASYEQRGEIYSRQQAGAAIQIFLMKIQEKGLATTWVGHFIEYLVKETLKIPEKINVEAIFPIGYELPEKGAKKRQHIDLDRILSFDEYKHHQMRKMPSINV